jgi:hypothetical protein
LTVVELPGMHQEELVSLSQVLHAVCKLDNLLRLGCHLLVSHEGYLGHEIHHFGGQIKARKSQSLPFADLMNYLKADVFSYSGL